MLLKKKTKKTITITNKLNLHQFKRKNSSKISTIKQFANKIHYFLKTQNLAKHQKKTLILLKKT